MSTPPDIDIQNDDNYSIDEDSLRQAVTTVLQMHESLEASLSIVFTTNDAVQALNQQYREVDAPTDVLSFPAEQMPPEMSDDAPYLGDLVIAYPYATEQATRLNHPHKESLMLLVVHGTLHLLGYDHDTPPNRAEMWAAQAQALEALQVDTNIVPSLEEDDHD